MDLEKAHDTIDRHCMWQMLRVSSPTEIITKTSVSDHNIIQIETNIKIVEEKQNHQITKSNLSYRDVNFFNEDIS